MLEILAAGDTPPFFILITIVLSSVVVMSLILAKFRQSLLVGYFLCGIVLANSGVLEWAGVADSAVINSLSEIGVVLLLFTLGIEFSISEIKALKRPALVGGGVQVGLTILVTTLICFLVGMPFLHGLVIGFACSLSSTAVSLKSFQDLQMPESPKARVTLGIAIFQDLAAIVFIVLLPTILSDDGVGSSALLFAMLKGLIFVATISVLSRNGFPQMLDAVARTRSRELFTLTVIGLCAAVALASGLLGLSPALGAFAAGVIVSESIYSHRVLSDILPFKDLFLTVFFVSVGLLIDLTVLQQNAYYIIVVTLTIILLKGAIAALAAKLSGLKMGAWIVPAAALCSTGEFSIVLFNKIGEFPVLEPKWEQIILGSTALSMGLVPTLMKLSLKYAEKRRRHKTSQYCKWEESMGLIQQIESMEDHVIVCGYGPVGQNLTENLIAAHIPFIVMEMNADTVKHLLNKGIKAVFADASDEESLHVANISTARSLAITFPACSIAIQAAKQARELNPNIIVYARSKFISDTEKLKAAGIQNVLHDEEQSGRAMIRTVMNCFEAKIEPSWKIENEVNP